MKVKFNKENKTAEIFAEVKFEDTGDSNILKGVAVVFGPLSSDRGGYKVRILKESINFEDEVFALWNHNHDFPLGSTVSNLQLSLDDNGISFSLRLPKTTLAADIKELVKERIVKGCSFSCVVNEWQEVQEGDEYVYEYTDILIDEITLTHIPAFIETSVALETNPSFAKDVESFQTAELVKEEVKEEDVKEEAPIVEEKVEEKVENVENVEISAELDLIYQEQQNQLEKIGE